MMSGRSDIAGRRQAMHQQLLQALLKWAELKDGEASPATSAARPSLSS